MTKADEVKYKAFLKNILHDLHCKSFQNILEYVDYSKFPDLLVFLQEDLEEALEEYDAIDEYGTSVDGLDDDARTNIIEYSGNVNLWYTFAVTIQKPGSNRMNYVKKLRSGAQPSDINTTEYRRCIWPLWLISMKATVTNQLGRGPN